MVYKESTVLSFVVSVPCIFQMFWILLMIKEPCENMQVIK